MSYPAYMTGAARVNLGEHDDAPGTAPPELVSDPALEKTIGQFLAENKARREYLGVMASRVADLTAAFVGGEPTRRAAESACEALLLALRDMEHVR